MLLSLVFGNNEKTVKPMNSACVRRDRKHAFSCFGFVHFFINHFREDDTISQSLPVCLFTHGILQTTTPISLLTRPPAHPPSPHPHPPWYHWLAENERVKQQHWSPKTWLFITIYFMRIPYFFSCFINAMLPWILVALSWTFPGNALSLSLCPSALAQIIAKAHSWYSVWERIRKNHVSSSSA